MSADVISGFAGRDDGPGRRPSPRTLLATAVLLLIGIGVVVVVRGDAARPPLTASKALPLAETQLRQDGSLRYTTTETLRYGGGSSSLPVTNHAAVSIITTLDPVHRTAESITRSSEVNPQLTSTLMEDIRIIGDTYYELITSPGEPPRPTPWLRDSTLNLGPLDGDIDSTDPAQALVPLFGLTGLTDLGHTDLAGVKTRHFRGQVPIGNSAAAFGSSLRLLTRSLDGTSIDEGTTSTADVYLDSANRLVRIHESAHLVSTLAASVYANFDATTDFCCAGQRVQVIAPPAGQTESGDEVLRQIASGHD